MVNPCLSKIFTVDSIPTFGSEAKCCLIYCHTLFNSNKKAQPLLYHQFVYTLGWFQETFPFHTHILCMFRCNSIHKAGEFLWNTRIIKLLKRCYPPNKDHFVNKVIRGYTSVWSDRKSKLSSSVGLRKSLYSLSVFLIWLMGIYFGNIRSRWLRMDTYARREDDDVRPEAGVL